MHKCTKMHLSILIKNARVVNEGHITESDILIRNERIDKIDNNITDKNAKIIDVNGLYVMPGCIDDQVHFREPGFPLKANIESESAAAVAGGITSYMDMPNTFPNALTIDILEDKYRIASQKSHANYSFFMGTSNSNIDEILSVDNTKICGVKIFMGSSTGNMLVDNIHTLEQIFSQSNSLIAVHCEDESTILKNLHYYSNRNENLDARVHPLVRSREACLISSTLAIDLAKKHGTQLHILHISTEDELKLFSSSDDVANKQITSEACVHHLFFSDEDYENLGNLIKCNPAIKTKADRTALRKALLEGKLDVIATDHAPHSLEEKQMPYMNAPSGLPLIQHSFLMMLTIGDELGWSLPFIVQKMSHNVATRFKIKDRGFIREGYFADLVVFDTEYNHLIHNKEVYYTCAWSPLNGRQLKGKISKTFVNGQLAYDGQRRPFLQAGQRLLFNRA